MSLLLIEKEKPSWIKVVNRVRYFGEYTEHGLFHIYMECPIIHEAVFILRQSRKGEKWFVPHDQEYPNDFNGLTIDEAVMKWSKEYYHLSLKKMELLSA